MLREDFVYSLIVESSSESHAARHLANHPPVGPGVARKRQKSALTADLERICTAKLAQIHSSTRGEPNHDEPSSAPLAMLITDLRADDALPKPLHTIMDVVEAQSRRIDDINAQLETARQALIERKAIERAKGLLMRTRRMSEKDAYTLIRQTAMNQNKRIIEVAEAILSMADLLK